MKINSLLQEGITASSSPDNAQSPAPHFGRSDKVLETPVEECTTSGAVATVASPVGGMQKRSKNSIFSGIKTSKKFANSEAVKESVTDEGFLGFGEPKQQPKQKLDYAAVRRMAKQPGTYAKQYHPEEYIKRFGAFAEEEMDEGDSYGSFAALKDWQVWNVHVYNNFYRGKYADYGPRLYSVVASSPEEARQIVIDNADYVLQDLLSRKLQNGKKVLPRGSALPIEEKRVGKAEPGSITTVGFKEMLTPEGPMNLKFAGGKIVASQDPVVQGQDLKTVAKADLGNNSMNLPAGYGDVVQPQKLKDVEEARVGNRMSDISVGSPKIVHYKGKAVGEVGLDHEASPGNGPYYFHHYLTGKAYVGYDTKQEALADLKHVVMQVDAKELEEGVWGDTAKLVGIPAVAGALAVGANHLDQQQPHVDIGGQSAKIVNYGPSQIPDYAMTLQGKDGKTYRVWTTRGSGGGHATLAVPTKEVKEAGDTPKGQEKLARVHHRAANRVTSKQADKDPAYARKAQQTQDRAWDRLAVKEQGVAEAGGNVPSGMTWQNGKLQKRPELVAAAKGNKNYQAYLKRKAAKEKAQQEQGQLDEVNPHNYDSDEDYYAALRAPAKQRSYTPPTRGVDPDDEDYFRAIFRKNKLAQQQKEREADHDRLATGTNEAEELDEKSKSQAQFRTMAAVAHNPKFAKKVGIKQSVGKEFHKADKKSNYKSLPKKVDEAEISEDMLAHELFKDLQIFKKSADKDIGNRPKDKEIGDKPSDKEVQKKK